MNIFRELLDKWYNPAIWVNWWKPPRFKWWFALDKHAGKPWYWLLWDGPITAHTVEMAMPFVIALLFGASTWGAYAIGVGIVFKGQVQKADALVYRDWSKRPGYNIQNMLYRTLIAAVPWGVLCLLV